MTNYGNGKIYKIERISDNVLVYVGSTTKEYISQRLVEHKRKAKICPNRRIYKLISDNGAGRRFLCAAPELAPEL